MNQHTSKLLKKYAHAIDKDFRQVKKWWDTLNWQQRTAWRTKIEATVSGEETQGVEVVTEETTA